MGKRGVWSVFRNVVSEAVRGISGRTHTHKDTIHSALTPETSSIQSFQSLLSHTAQRRASTERKEWTGWPTCTNTHSCTVTRLDASGTPANMCLFWSAQWLLIWTERDSDHCYTVLSALPWFPRHTRCKAQLLRLLPQKLAIFAYSGWFLENPFLRHFKVSWS